MSTFSGLEIAVRSPASWSARSASTSIAVYDRTSASGSRAPARRRSRRRPLPPHVLQQIAARAEVEEQREVGGAARRAGARRGGRRARARAGAAARARGRPGACEACARAR